MKYSISIILLWVNIITHSGMAQSYTYATEGFEAAVWAVPATSYSTTTGTWTTSSSTVLSSPSSPNTTNGGTKCLSIPSAQYLTSPTLNNGAATLSFYARSTSTTARTITISTSTDGIAFTILTTASSAASSLSYALINIAINNAAVKNIRITYPSGGGGAIDDIIISAVIPANFYNAPNADVSQLSNWWSNSDGASGTHPPNFTTPPLFTISHAGATMNASWTISSLSLPASNTLTLGSNSLKINGSITGTGTLTSSGSSSLVIAGNAGTLNFTAGAQIIKDLTFNSNATATLGTPLDIIGGTSSGTLTVASGATLTTANNLTLKSAMNGTARVAQSAGTISGNVTVERYIPANNTRAWRLLAIPVISNQSFHTTWQENQAAGVPGNNNLGVNLTSSRTTWSADGFDYRSNGDGLLVWNGAANSGSGGWVGVTNTSSQINSDYGYMLYTRGDRNATPSNTSITSTVLRTSGLLKQGPYPTTPIAVPAAQYALIGNPYVSQIDFRNITRGAGIDNIFYVWDPKLSGSNGLGAFQTMAFDGTNYIITPGGGSYGANGTVMNTIESGAGFFVHATTAGNISFTESTKTTGSNMVFAPSVISEKLAANLYSVNTVNSLVDGTLVLYDNSYSDSVTAEDAGKLQNFEVNMSMARDGISLAIEKRKIIGTTDTIFFNTSGLIQHQYLLEIITTNLDHPALFGYLQDAYLGTTSPLNLNGTTPISFSIDGNPASASPGRFRILFSPLATLPVRFTNVQSYAQTRSIDVRWTFENERDILYYDVDRSGDGTSFTKKATLAAQNRGNYNWVDISPLPGDNYYRIKSVSASGEITFSVIVKSNLPALKPGIYVYPNPVSGHKIDLRLSLPAAKYYVALFDGIGRRIFTTTVVHDGSNNPYSIPYKPGGGVYHIIVINAKYGRWNTRVFY